MDFSKLSTKEIPKLPASALIFYLSVLVMWQLGFIPSPTEIFRVLEDLYQTYGLPGLAAASFLEGIVYLGLYFPGSFVVALAVFLTDGSFKEFFPIAALVTFVLTITSTINYVLGRFVLPPEKIQTKQSNKVFSKGMLASMLHPNSLAFYFFHAGIKRKNPLKILFVPVFILPYGLALAYLLFFFKTGLRKAIENPVFMIAILSSWLVLAFAYSKKKTKTK